MLPIFFAILVTPKYPLPFFTLAVSGHPNWSPATWLPTPQAALLSAFLAHL